MSRLIRCDSRTRYALVLILLVAFMVTFVPAQVFAGDDDIWQPGYENRPEQANAFEKDDDWYDDKENGWGETKKPADKQPMKGEVTSVLINTLMKVICQLPTPN